MFLFPMPIVPHSLPPNPSLVAIILIITTRRGPRFVFHYPGVPEPSQPTNSWAFGSIGSDSEDSGQSSDDDGTDASAADDTASRTGSVSSNRLGDSRHGSASGRSSRFPPASVSTRRTTRTLREDGPDDEDDADDDIEDLDLTATDAKPVNKEAKATEDDASASGKSRTVEWEKVLGYPTEGLEKLLSPPDKFKKKKFEVSLEEMVFLGHPVFAKDGAWKSKEKKKKKRRKQKRHRGDNLNGDDLDETDKGAAEEISGAGNPFIRLHSKDDNVSVNLDSSAAQAGDLDSPELSPTTTRDDARIPKSAPLVQPSDDISQSFDSTAGMSEAASEAKSGSTASAAQNGDNMTMFHLVFVMNPPTLEYHIRVQEMYDNVVKKFSKALKYEQARSGWVEQEAKKILTIKAQAKESSECVLQLCFDKLLKSVRITSSNVSPLGQDYWAVPPGKSDGEPLY